MVIAKTYHHTPVGVAYIECSPKGITAIRLVKQIEESLDPKHPTLVWAIQQLDRYFYKSPTLPFTLPLDAKGTPFQHKVWRALQTIPVGKTYTYGSLAKTLDMPNGARAIGTACGKNPIWLVVPCHRVVGSNGKLTGYAWGIDIKRKLLQHESQTSVQTQLQLF